MPTELLQKIRPGGGRRGGAPGSGGGFDGEDAWSSRGPAPASTASLALLFTLAAITMLFVAFTTTYLGHRQNSSWKAIPLPGVLWLNTGLLVGSSAALAWAQRRLKQGSTLDLRRGLALAGAFGLAFLIGQLVAWRQLAQHGVYLASNPHSSYFYLLTGIHGLHLLGGLAALGVIFVQAWRGAYTPPASTAVNLTTMYWHFLAGLWIFLFVMLFWP
jgi:cytochrome c oxidase subunit 3